jgi:hypothetical protein
MVKKNQNKYFFLFLQHDKFILKVDFYSRKGLIPPKLGKYWLFAVFVHKSQLKSYQIWANLQF